MFGTPTLTANTYEGFHDVYIETHALNINSPLETMVETFVRTEVTIDENWKLAMEHTIDNETKPRNRRIMFGNCTNTKNGFPKNKVVDVKPLHLGLSSSIKMKLILDDIPTLDSHKLPLPTGVSSSYTQKKVESFGANVLLRQPKYVTE